MLRVDCDGTSLMTVESTQAAANPQIVSQCQALALTDSHSYHCGFDSPSHHHRFDSHGHGRIPAISTKALTKQ